VFEQKIYETAWCYKLAPIAAVMLF